MEKEDYEIIFKVVLAGDQYVGKTNILSKYLKNEFDGNSKPTCGVGYGEKDFNIEGHTIKAKIWDTAGTEKYKAITSAYYKGAVGAFIVYDITNKETLKSVEKWVNDIRSVANKNIAIILIGNKSDLENQREITKEQGKEKAFKIEAAFIETSALSGDNLEKAFEMMMNEIYNKCHNQILTEGDITIIQGGEDVMLERINDDLKKKKTCC